MKKIIFLNILALILIFTSCKKGENDPFITLRSREARLTGEWSIKSGIITNENNGIIRTTNYTSTNYIVTESGVNIDTVAFTKKVTIEKDGTYQIEKSIDGKISTEQGNWVFGRESKDLNLKNKEYVIFFVTSEIINGTTNVYSGKDVKSYIWILNQLKNKEIIISVNSTIIKGTDVVKNIGVVFYEQE